jgi:hypothetical protein
VPYLPVYAQVINAFNFPLHLRKEHPKPTWNLHQESFRHCGIHIWKIDQCLCKSLLQIFFLRLRVPCKSATKLPLSLLNGSASCSPTKTTETWDKTVLRRTASPYQTLSVIRRYQTTWYDPTSVHTNTLIHIDKICEDHAERCCFDLPFRKFNSLTWFRATMFSGISIGSGLSNLWVRSDKGPKQLLRNVHVFFWVSGFGDFNQSQRCS